MLVSGPRVASGVAPGWTQVWTPPRAPARPQRSELHAPVPELGLSPPASCEMDPLESIGLLVL